MFRNHLFSAAAILAIEFDRQNKKRDCLRRLPSNAFLSPGPMAPALMREENLNAKELYGPGTF